MKKKHGRKIMEKMGSAAKATEESLKRRRTASPMRRQIPFKIKQISLNPHHKFDPADGYLKQVLASAGLKPKKPGTGAGFFASGQEHVRLTSVRMSILRIYFGGL